MSYLACVCGAGCIYVGHIWVFSPDRFKVPWQLLPSFIVAIALMDLIYDNRFIPEGLGESSVVFQRFCELIGALILLELGINVIWRPVERVINLLTKLFLLGTGLVSEELFTSREPFIVGCVTVTVALVILVYAGLATDHFNLLHNRGNRVQTTVRLNVEATLRFLKREQRATGMPLPEYAETLQRYKDAATRRRRGLDFQRHFQYD